MGLLKFLGYLIKHLVVFTVIVGLILAVSVILNVFGPPQFIYSDTSWEDTVPYVPDTTVKYDVLIDQHSHSKYSDGKLTIRQNIEWHMSLGFTVVVITDHNTMENAEDTKLLAEEYKNRCIVIQGMEWTTNRVHLSFIGLEEWDFKIPVNPTDEEIMQAIDEVHRQNGTVTYNHPGYTRRTSKEPIPSYNLLMNWGVDFFEVINGLDFDEESYAFALNNNDSIGLVTGTDMHSPQKEDGGRVYAWTALNLTSFSEEAVMMALRNHQTEIIINKFGIESHGDFKYNKFYDYLSPFYQIGGVLKNLYLYTDMHSSYSNRVILYVFLSYSALFFAVLETVSAFRRSLKYPK